MIEILALSPLVVTGAVLLLLPNLTSREQLFGVPVKPNFNKTSEAQLAIRNYRLTVAGALVLGLLLALRPVRWYGLLAPVMLTVVGAAAYYKANRLVTPFSHSEKVEPSMELSTRPDQLPRFAWLGIFPFALLFGAALVLGFMWNEIPAEFPVHTGLNGTPDRWAEKTARSVYGPIFFGLELCVWSALVAVRSWYGARRSGLRLTLLRVFVGVLFSMAFLFAFIALQPLFKFPGWSIFLLILAIAASFIVYAIRKADEPSNPADKTPAECWKAGFVYYNPNDAVLFVQKRMGMGYTMNFANPWSWLTLATLFLIVITAPLVLA